MTSLKCCACDHGDVASLAQWGFPENLAWGFVTASLRARFRPEEPSSGLPFGSEQGRPCWSLGPRPARLHWKDLRTGPAKPGPGLEPARPGKVFLDGCLQNCLNFDGC